MGINTPVELIAAATAAETTEQPFKIIQAQVPCTLMADNLAGAEEVDVFFSVDNGTNWSVLQVDGSPVVLTSTYNAKTFYGPMMIGVKKDATAGACGVYMAVSNK